MKRKKREPILFSTSDASRILRVSPQTLANWRVIGKGPKFVKKGVYVFYPEDEIVAFKKQKKTRVLYS